jgi:membrane-associated phospholipid phosphatase
MKQAGLSPLFYIILLCCSLSLIATSLINLVWKVSAHMVGIGGVIGAVIALSVQLDTDFFYILSSLILLAGLLGYSRLKLNAHTPAQVYLGFVVGFLPQMIIIL